VTAFVLPTTQYPSDVSDGKDRKPFSKKIVPRRSRQKSRVKKNRKKHNEAEMKRRKKLNETLEELAELCEQPRAQKAHVLRAAASRIKSLQKKIGAVKDRIALLQSSHVNLTSKNLEVEEKNHREMRTTTTNSSTQSQTGQTGVQPGSQESSLIIGSSSTDEEKKSVKMEQSLQEKDLDLTIPKLPSFDRRVHTNTDHGLDLEGKNMNTSSDEMYGFSNIQDIVEYKRRTSHVVASVLQSAQLHLNHQSLFNTSTIAECLCSGTGKILDCTPLFGEMLGYTREAIFESSRTYFSLLHRDCVNSARLVMQSLFSGNIHIHEVTKKLLTRESKVMICRTTCWISNDDEGKPAYYREILVPIESS